MNMAKVEKEPPEDKTSDHRGKWTERLLTESGIKVKARNFSTLEVGVFRIPPMSKMFPFLE